MATNTPPPRTPSPSAAGEQARPLPGSWEGVLEQAREYAGNGNSQAIGQFEKVINGLAKLPESRRRAKDGRLQTVYLQAVIGLQSFYATRDRFEDALGVIQAALPQAGDEERLYLEEHIIGLQFMAGYNDTAIAKLRARAEADDSDITDWNAVVWGYIRSDRPHEALPLLDTLEERLGAAPPADAESGDTSTASVTAPDTAAATAADAEDDSDSTDADDLANEEDDADEEDDPQFVRAALDGMRGVTLIETGDYEGGIAAFERSLTYPASPFRNSLHLLYSRLSNAGHYEAALRFIQRDGRNPIRAGFWRGLTYQRQDRRDDARAAWRSLSELDQQQLGRAPVEYTLAQFYLGDPEGATLSNLLEALREMEQPNWSLLMLAGVGFAARGDNDTAANDFRLAVSMVKSLGEGRKLPVGVWQMVRDIFTPEQAERFAPYFQMPLPKTHSQGETQS